MTEQIDSATPKETVTLSIDGQEVTVAAGTKLIEAARAIGLDIASFCYHPGLSIVAQCRQCLVKVEGAPKLVPSCHANATAGMVVHTTDDESRAARKQMLEFTLVNHPIDCPICDKAGECTLQRLYFDNDNADSRVSTPKVRKPKVVDLGPHIVLDAERCILCTRCIRVCDEVAGTHQLEMSQRGDHKVLGPAPGRQLDNPYSLNTVDVCPVGALTSKHFRFAMRTWELFATPSICSGCATGCNIEIHHKAGQIWRVVPRENPDVNRYWMCDEGRLAYREHSVDRLASPSVDGAPSTWKAAIERAAATLTAAIKADRSRVGVVFSPHYGNEDNYALARLCRDILQLERFYIGGRSPVPDRADDVLRDADVTPNRRGIREILGDATPAGAAVLEDDILSGEIGALVCMGHLLPLGEEALARAADLDAVIAITRNQTGIASAAHVALPACASSEASGSFTNRDGRVQRFQVAIPPPGQAMPAWEIVCKLAMACDAALAYDDAQAVFAEMVSKVPAFSGAEWGRDLPPCQLRFANSRG